MANKSRDRVPCHSSDDLVISTDDSFCSDIESSSAAYNSCSALGADESDVFSTSGPHPPSDGSCEEPSATAEVHLQTRVGSAATQNSSPSKSVVQYPEGQSAEWKEGILARRSSL